MGSPGGRDVVHPMAEGHGAVAAPARVHHHRRAALRHPVPLFVAVRASAHRTGGRPGAALLRHDHLRAGRELVPLPVPGPEPAPAQRRVHAQHALPPAGPPSGRLTTSLDHAVHRGAAGPGGAGAVALLVHPSPPDRDRVPSAGHGARGAPSPWGVRPGPGRPGQPRSSAGSPMFARRVRPPAPPLVRRPAPGAVLDRRKRAAVHRSPDSLGHRVAGRRAEPGAVPVHEPRRAGRRRRDGDRRRPPPGPLAPRNEEFFEVLGFRLWDDRAVVVDRSDGRS